MNAEDYYTQNQEENQNSEKESVLEWKPQFLFFPLQLIVDGKLSPTDKLLYGVLFWLNNFSYTPISVSNEYLAQLLNCHDRSIQRSLKKLELRGYIKRFLDNDSKKRYIQIVAIL